MLRQHDEPHQQTAEPTPRARRAPEEEQAGVVTGPGTAEPRGGGTARPEHEHQAAEHSSHRCTPPSPHDPH